MPNATHETTIEIERIDLTDETYWVPCYADMGPLISSVEAVGIVNAPIVQACDDERFRPVIGRRRIRAAKDLGWVTVSAKTLAADYPVDAAFNLALSDNTATRVLDPAALAVVVDKVLRLFSPDRAVEEILPSLRVPPRGPRLQRLQRIASLEQPILEALGRTRILEKTAHLMTDMNADDRHWLLEALSTLGLNANKAAELAEELFDLAVLTTVPVRDAAGPEALGILSDSDMERPQRAEAFRRLVRRRKFPETAGLETEFVQRFGPYSNDPRIRVKPAPAFENEECTVTIKTETWDDAERLINIVIDTERFRCRK